MSTDLDVAVVGAGIAGLTTAHELRRAGLSVRVFEARPHVGGRMATVRHEGYTIDTGAEQISSRGYRATWELIRRTGIADEDIPPIRRTVGVWRDGRARSGLTGAGMPPRARLRLARLLTAKGFDPDRPEDSPLGLATVAEFARGLHPDLHDYLFQPVSAMFFGWDTERSAAAPLVSLLLSVGPASSWRTYAHGMDTLARRLAASLDVVTGQPVERVVAERDHATVSTATGPVRARVAVLCVPAPVAARLHANPGPAEAAFLAACGFSSILKVSCLLDRPLGPRGRYLLATPAAEDSELSGIVVDHAKHPGRVPAGRGLLSLCAAPALAAAPDAEIGTRLITAAERYVPGLAAATTGTLVHRFRHALPEATPSALALRAGFAARPTGPVEYAGDWVLLRTNSEGAVRSAALAAARVRAHLGQRQKEAA